jgi:hypothetical protein
MVPKWSPVYSGRMPAQIIYFNAAAQAHFGHFWCLSTPLAVGIPFEELVPTGVAHSACALIAHSKVARFPKMEITCLIEQRLYALPSLLHCLFFLALFFNLYH